MKQLYLLLFLTNISYLYSQVTLSHARVTEHERTVSSTQANDAIYRVVQPFGASGRTDGFIRKTDVMGTFIGSPLLLSNYNPGVNVTQPFSIISHENNIYALAQTWGTSGSGGKVTESLMKISPDLSPLDEVKQLHAYQSRFEQMGIDDQYLYLIYSDAEPDAKVGGTYNGGGASMINHIGTTVDVKYHLLILDANDPTQLIKTVVIKPDENIGVLRAIVDGQSYPGNITILSNRHIAINIIKDNNILLMIVDPNDAEIGTTGKLKTVHEFVYDASIDGRATINYCNNQYIIGTRRSGRIRTYNDNFELTSENHPMEYSSLGSPVRFECLSDGSIQVVSGTDGIGGETNQFIYLDDAMIEESFLHYQSPDWKMAYQAHRVSDTEYLVVANYRLFAPANFAGITIPAADYYNGNDYHTVTFQVSLNKPTGGFTINADPPEFLTVHRNNRLDPSDPTNLIPCSDCVEDWVTIAPGTVLPADRDHAQFLIDAINVPDGYKVWNANMGTDPTRPVGFQRYFYAGIVPDYVNNNLQVATHGYYRRVYITEQTFTSADTDGDGIPDASDTDDDNDGNPDTSDPHPLVAVTSPDVLEAIGTANSSVNVLANDDFLPGGSTTLVNTGTGSAQGTIVFDATTGILSYTPTAEELDSEISITVHYTVCSGLTSNVCKTEMVIITPRKDSDGDGIPDASDTDDDNDGVLDSDDLDPLDPTICRDSDNDGCDDCSQTGADNSGGDPLNDGTDTDGDGICDASDTIDNGDDDNDGVINQYDQCANTPTGAKVNAIGCLVFDPVWLTAQGTNPTCPGKKGFIEVFLDRSVAMQVHISLASAATSQDFNNITIPSNGYHIANLDPGDYVVTVNAFEYGYTQEFGITIGEVQAVSARRAETYTAFRSASYQVSGSSTYTVTVNNRSFTVDVGTTATSSIYVDGLGLERNTVTIHGASDCQGSVTDIVDIDLGIRIYPNPSVDYVHVAVSYDYEVILYDFTGRSISRKNVRTGDTVEFTMSHLSPGMYILQFIGDENSFTKKIIKK